LVEAAGVSQTKLRKDVIAGRLFGIGLAGVWAWGKEIKRLFLCQWLCQRVRRFRRFLRFGRFG
jgi:hypothetical protein